MSRAAFLFLAVSAAASEDFEVKRMDVFASKT
jgi:hypothetical protein